MNGVIAKKGKNGLAIYNADALLTMERRIWLSGEIDHECSYKIINQLLTLDNDSNKEITMYISSGGGSIYDGLAIYDTMNIIKSPIRTIAVGIVASMASVIFSAGEKGRREILPYAKILIHDPRVIGRQEVVTASQMVEMGNDLQNIKNCLNGILASNCEKSLEEVNKDTLKDNYMTATEAIEYGIADKICERM